jgi:hypothetical protein
MKEVLSVFTFGIGALCFMVFVTVLKPNAISAVPGPSKPEYCNREASPEYRCPPHVFAAISVTNVGQR